MALFLLGLDESLLEHVGLRDLHPAVRRADERRQARQRVLLEREGAQVAQHAQRRELVLVGP